LVAVLEEKSSLMKNQDDFQKQLSNLTTNQSILGDNLTSIFSQIEILTSQLTALNLSVTSVMGNLENAPQLKTVPGDMAEVMKDLAQFGSRLADIENQAKETANSVKSIIKVSAIKQPETTRALDVNVDALTSVWDEKLRNESLRLDERIDTASERFKQLGTNLTELLQKQEIHAEKSWKVLDKLTNDLQNVSAKASSNAMVSRANKVEITKLRTDLQEDLSLQKQPSKIKPTTGPANP
jgi:hypothetical protein